MPSFTKQVIKNTFISLLAEHPLNEISVKMVVETAVSIANLFTIIIRIFPRWWRRYSGRRQIL